MEEERNVRVSNGQFEVKKNIYIDFFFFKVWHSGLSEMCATKGRMLRLCEGGC